MKLSSPLAGAVIDFDPFQVRSNSDGTHDLGGLIQLNDMRSFRYGKAGAANISKGKVQLAPAPVANHANCTMGYDYSAERKFCGLCILRMRGWSADWLTSQADENTRP